MSWGGGILAYSKSFATFNTHKEFNIIQGKIPNKSGDIKLAVLVGEDKYKGEGFPPKENHKFKGYTCTNGVTLTWNKGDWTATITTGKPTTCILEFETYTSRNLIEVLKDSGELVTFTHEDTAQTGSNTNVDYRYVGANPNNYISFNDELWRIIGIFNTDDGTGKYEERVKLIRATGIVTIAWDSNTSTDWTNASLKTLLNSGDYYNRQNTYANTGLTDTAKGQIADAKWYLGGWRSAEITAEDFFRYERGTTVCNGRTINWNGQVGFMYPSDYGLATGASCSNENLVSYNDNCANANWIYKGNYTNNDTTASGMSYASWLLSSHTSELSLRIIINANGSVHGIAANDWCVVRPTVYLKTNILTTSGTGSKTDPYILE